MSQALRTVLRAKPRASLIMTRPYHATSGLRMAYKDSQDRETLRPGSTENTKTGRDDETASANPDAAFNPNKTSPESAQQSAREESGQGATNPLQASGANQELSKPTGDEKTIKKRGAGKETQKGGASGRGSAPKGSEPGRV